jgi:hypothetical protein
MKKYPSVLINCGNLKSKELARLSRAIVDELKEIVPQSQIVHRSFTGNEILIEVKSAWGRG